MKSKDMILWGLIILVLILIIIRLGSVSNYDRSPANKGNIIVYGSKTCPWCVKQEKWLTDNGVPYTFVDCKDGNCPNFVDAFPTLMINNEIKKGYTELGPPSSYPSPSQI